MKTTLSLTFLFCCILSLLLVSPKVYSQTETQQWTNYRGPQHNGISQAINIPTTWNDSTNVAWKTTIPGQGWSSPVLMNQKIWITSALNDGKKLLLLSVNSETGEIENQLLLFKKDSLQEQHPLNSFASPSPVIEKGRVYAHFGAYGTACVSTKTGKILWERTDLHCEHEVGPGSSPVIYKDLLILNYDGTDVRFVIALDKYTGETVWKTERDIDVNDMPISNRKSFTTPIITKVNNKDQLISVGPHVVMGYKPLTGEQIWKANFKGFSASACPIVNDDMLFFNSGFSLSSILALRLGGEGDITDSIKWINKKSTQARSSALYIDGYIYMVNTGGQAKCLDAATGEEVWTQRIGLQTSASPIFADGKIYSFDQEGLTTIFKPGKVFELVTENQLPDGFMASPAVVDNALFLRTKTHLYKIVEK